MYKLCLVDCSYNTQMSSLPCVSTDRLANNTASNSKIHVSVQWVYLDPTNKQYYCLLIKYKHTQTNTNNMYHTIPGLKLRHGETAFPPTSAK